ncbi:FAD-dependent oxidoreductase [Curtobacterium sp. B18]|uniref:FAD-dependent oxidoreductase n=1 Tax=Curtobacterium sp. B18 TaxID=95614 RepID=UPI0003B40947|nr:FAD-dependent oxidoreductase [Curtobacterium sp. B18]
MTTERVDVLVVGGGPVGLFVAALLAARGVEVAVWERRSGAPTGSRAIGIHPPSLDAFAAIGLDAPVLREAVRVRQGVARSRGRTLGTLTFDRASTTHPYVATLDQHRTEALLRDALAAAAPDALRTGTALATLERHADHVDAVGTDARGSVAVRARFVVGADGARSAVRDLLGISTTGRDYPDRYAMGDFADVEGSAARTAALVDVGPAGVVESFPLPGDRRRYVALLTPSDDPAPDATALAAIVAGRTGVRPDPDSCSMLSGFGIRRRQAERVGVGRVVLVGDAAHEISPIGGQGMNLGWLDAAALAPLLAEGLRTGSAGPWPEYARRRQAVARRAARQAEVNMALGRPFGRPLGRVGAVGREALLRTVLSLPSADGLAGVYAMRWA